MVTRRAVRSRCRLRHAPKPNTIIGKSYLRRLFTVSLLSIAFFFKSFLRRKSRREISLPISFVFVFLFFPDHPSPVLIPDANTTTLLFALSSILNESLAFTLGVSPLGTLPLGAFSLGALSLGAFGLGRKRRSRVLCNPLSTVVTREVVGSATCNSATTPMANRSWCRLVLSSEMSGTDL